MCTTITADRRGSCGNHFCWKCSGKRGWWEISAVSAMLFISFTTIFSIVYCSLEIDLCLTSCSVCLDGSPPAYHFHKGSGAGINNWIVHFEVYLFLQNGNYKESIPTLENIHFIFYFICMFLFIFCEYIYKCCFVKLPTGSEGDF